MTLRALENAREKNKGQYVDYVVAFCDEKFEWDRPKTLAAIETAKQVGAIKEVVNKNKKLSLRANESRDASKAEDNPVIAEEVNSTIDSDNLRQDFIDFKKFVHAEVLSMKAWFSSQTNADSGKNSGSVEPNFEQLFIKSLQDRIISLERQLNQKQQIIDKLLEERCKQIELLPLKSSDTRVRSLDNKSGNPAPEQIEKTQSWMNSKKAAVMAVFQTV